VWLNASIYNVLFKTQSIYRSNEKIPLKKEEDNITKNSTHIIDVVIAQPHDLSQHRFITTHLCENFVVCSRSKANEFKNSKQTISNSAFPHILS
jgi:hypothetical protein